MNLPLLHRLWVGIAKVKVAGKENGVVHGKIRKWCNDYNNNSCNLASCFIDALPAGVAQAVAPFPQWAHECLSHLIQISFADAPDAKLGESTTGRVLRYINHGSSFPASYIDPDHVYCGMPGRDPQRLSRRRTTRTDWSMT